MTDEKNPTIWTTDPPPQPGQQVQASVYSEKRARVWTGTAAVFIEVHIGHLELHGALHAWREVAEVLDRAMAVAEAREAERAIEAVAREHRRREGQASEPIPTFEEVFGPAPEVEDDEVKS